jgi:ParB family chromosome partitioning protein
LARKGLGKGLGALLENIDNEDSNSVKEISINLIEPNLNQPRKNFDNSKLNDLADSIKEHGIIQPIIVKEESNGLYKIIAGERRWRAARLAGLKNLPVIIKNYFEANVLEIALIENIQREDLNPLEESEAYKKLLDEYNLTQDEISKRVGKSRSFIANSLRLLNLEDDVKILLADEKISMGHARALLGVEDKEKQIQLANRIVREKLSVREIEAIIRKNGNKIKKKNNNDKNKINDEYLALEESLTEILCTKVKIHNKKDKGIIEIEYYTPEELERIIEIIHK